MLLIFASTCLATGRVWRFPFDDEIYNLLLDRRFNALQLIFDYARATDIHPPLQYLLVAGLKSLGLSPAAMRLVSLAMTAGALAIYHLLTLSLLSRPSDRDIKWPTRLIAILLFGLCPLAVSQGDALRWYPMFALETALAVVLYLAASNGTARFASAAALGLAGSTNVLAGTVAASLAIYRYGFERRFFLRFDLTYWLLALAFGALGVFTAVMVFIVRTTVIASQIGNNLLQAIATNLLGFFGGAALGVSQAWIVVPSVAITGLAIVTAIDRRQPQNPLSLLLLLLATAALTVLPGFAKPRSFLYLAPVVASLLTIYLDQLLRRGHCLLAVLFCALLFAANCAAIVHIDSNSHPFKRESAIPFGQVLDVVRTHRTGATLVVSTDPVVAWLLQQDQTSGRDCISDYTDRIECVRERRFDSIIVVYGHGSRSTNARAMRRMATDVKRLTEGRERVAQAHAGIDDDAELKTRLTGVPLDRNILTIDVYR